MHKTQDKLSFIFLRPLEMALRFFIQKIAVATLVLLLASLTFIHEISSAKASTSTLSEVIGYFGTSYQPQAIATKKSLSLVSRKVKKNHPTFKLISSFSRTPVTYDFAITKLCTAGKWSITPRNYTNCRSFAEAQGFLSAPLETNPSSPRITTLTYEQLATLLARVIDGRTQVKITPTNPVSTPTGTTPPSRNLSTGSLNNVSSETYDVHYFSTVQLDEPLPKNFYLGELYFLNGTIHADTTNDIFAFTCDAGDGCNSTANFVSTAKNNRFSIPVYFGKTGTFNLGIIPGLSGQSRLASVTVLGEEPPLKPVDAPKATNLTTNYSKGATTFSWNTSGFTQSGNSFTRVVVYQQNKRVDFLMRQPLQSFAPSSKYFRELVPGSARWFVQQNGADSATMPLNLSTQNFYKQEASLTVTNFEDYYPNGAPVTLRFSGRTTKELSNKIAITLPNGKVKEIIVSPQNFSAGSSFSFSVTLTDPGTYIFEINDLTGAAVLNAPLIVGDATPLLPDFFALSEQKLNTESIGNIDSARQVMLSLINKDRRDNGLPPVSLDISLNNVAQSHSQSMLNHNFFSHTDNLGRSPDDRRRAFNIPTPIRENLGKSNSLEHVEAGLMRSPIHRDALLDARMKRVGIGITKTADGYYLVTQNFTGDALSVQNILDIKQGLLDHVATFRQLKSIQSLQEDPQASRAAVEWATTMSSQDFFTFTCPSNKSCSHTSVSAAVRAQGVTGGFEVYTVRTSDETVLVDEVLGQDALSDSTYSKIGLGFGVGRFGEVYLVVLYL